MRLAECRLSSTYLGVALGRVSIVIAIPAAQLIELHSLIGSMTGQEQVVAGVDFPCKALRNMDIFKKHQSHVHVGAVSATAAMD